jgi:hypothetical protein
MTTNRTDFTKKQRLAAFYHNAMWLKEHDVEGERHSGMNGIWCQFGTAFGVNSFFQGKMN